jgi:hypothetical protein
MRKGLILALVCIPVAVALGGKKSGAENSPEAVLSHDESVRDAAVVQLRERGRVALDELFAIRDGIFKEREAVANDPDAWTRLNEQLARLDEAIDQVGGQRYCTASRLYWHTDFERARAEAERTGKPILGLRMLGNLTDEFSCANSRFFRTTLYSNADISKLLREKFVLHWSSVRPVPRVTIDFGDGRKIERTITGNSAHYALAADGRTLDALPGLYGPTAFIGWLKRVEHLSQMYRSAADADRDSLLTDYHARRSQQIDENWTSDLANAGIDSALAPEALTDEAAWQQIAALHAGKAALDPSSIELIRLQNPNARQAGRLAVTKMRVEDPIVRLVAELQNNIALDTVRNEYQLHRRIHERLASDPAASQNADTLNEWVYAELFLTPSTDPWLGLAPANGYTALPNNGLVLRQRELAAGR